MQDVKGKISLNAQTNPLQPVMFPRVQLNNSLQKAGENLIKAKQIRSSVSVGDKLQTESVRVPVDDGLQVKTRIEQRTRPNAAIEEAKKRD